MSDQPVRVSAREIADFLTTLRQRHTAPRFETALGQVELLAWKASILDRIAAQSSDPETRALAAAARADLAAARAELAAAQAAEQVARFEGHTGGKR